MQLLYKHTVHVDVYLLRHRGAKLSKDRLTGFRGHLRLSGCIVSGEAGRPSHRSYTASLTDGTPPHYPGAAIMHLHGAVLTRLDARGFVLTGEEIAPYQERHQAYPQAWFCVPVAPAAPT